MLLTLVINDLLNVHHSAANNLKQVQQAFVQLKAWGIRPGEHVPPEFHQADSGLLGRFWQRTNTSSDISSAPALHGSSTHSGSAKADRSARGGGAKQQGSQLLDDVVAAASLVKRSAASFTSGIGSGGIPGSSFSSGHSGRLAALGLYPSLGLDSTASVDDVDRQQQRTHSSSAAGAASSRAPAAAAAAAHDSSSRAADQDAVLNLPADVHKLRDDSASEQQPHQQQRLLHSDGGTTPSRLAYSSSAHKDNAAAAGSSNAANLQPHSQQHEGDWQHATAVNWAPSGQQQSHSAPLSGRSSSGVPSLTLDAGTGTMSTHVSTYSSMERQQSHEGSGSRLWSASGLALRFSRTLSRAAPREGSGRLTPPATVLQGLQSQIQMVRVVVRIGVATGPLPFGQDVANCAVKHRAKGEHYDKAALRWYSG